MTTIYLLLRMMQAAALIAYLVGSLLLAGGQIAAGRAPMWGVAIDYPVFSFPGLLSLAVSVIGLILAVAVLATARVKDSGRVGGAFAATGAATASSAMFAWMLPSDEATEATLRWAAAGVDVAATLLLMVAALIFAVRDDRARKSEGRPIWTPGQES
ncbi:hypothetical protein [Microbacterium sp. J1-1]|nr:hypothetical protein [Microbacterium sp. J1-1]UUE21145.1 hypothetical protein LRQ07_02425 [Microbacterium sp. J1-1]